MRCVVIENALGRKMKYNGDDMEMGGSWDTFKIAERRAKETFYEEGDSYYDYFLWMRDEFEGRRRSLCVASDLKARNVHWIDVWK